jgi:hypothetical protein
MIEFPDEICGRKTNFTMEPERCEAITATRFRFVVRRVDQYDHDDIAAFTQPADAVEYCRHIYRRDFGYLTNPEMDDPNIAHSIHDEHAMYGVIFTDTGDVVFVIGPDGELRDMSPANMGFPDDPEDYIDYEATEGWA